MGERLNLAILISGRGSNMKALIEACRDPAFPARVAVVLSSKADADGLQTARTENIPAFVVEGSGRAAFEAALESELVRHPVDLICLAGFMKILSADFISRREGRIINIHPSLLPAYKGLDTYARALADGVAESGCSVHMVTAGVDEGPVLLQRRVPVMPGDDEAALAARILAEEHKVYPEAVRLMAKRLLK